MFPSDIVEMSEEALDNGGEGRTLTDTSRHSDGRSASRSVGRALKPTRVKNVNRARFFSRDYRVRSFSPSAGGFEFRGSGDKNFVELCRRATYPRDRNPTGRAFVSPEGFPRDGGRMKLQRHWTGARNRRRRISGRLLFCLSAPAVIWLAEILTNLSPRPAGVSSRLRRYVIAVRNKKQLKFVR